MDNRPSNYKRFLVLIPDGWRARILSGVLFTAVVVALQNLDPVEFRVLFWTIPALPKMLLMAACFGLGFASLWLGQHVVPRRHDSADAR